MKTKSAIVALLLASVAVGISLPMGGATHPNTACINHQAVHSYGGWGGVGGGSPAGPSSFGGGAIVSTAIVRDSCDQDLDGDGIPFDHDGDYETGLASGAFPAGTKFWCTDAPGSSHHTFGPGAEYWASDDSGVSAIVYWAGTDGYAILPSPLDPCGSGDGIITSNPVTDPYDCGSGALGYSMSWWYWTPATLGRNTYWAADCDPIDGYAYVFLLTGVYVDEYTGAVIVSAPFSGHIWSGGHGYEYGSLERVGVTSDPPHE